MVVELDVGVDARAGKAGAVEFPGAQGDYHCLRRVRVRVRVRVGNGGDCEFAKWGLEKAKKC